jgi:hypothetical protein
MNNAKAKQIKQAVVDVLQAHGHKNARPTSAMVRKARRLYVALRAQTTFSPDTRWQPFSASMWIALTGRLRRLAAR